ncbi:transposable element Tcb1 transposase [Trichonephila clavipes]|nr:transposable element Tcb1 transposase [Trichonephila clavipes]
MQVDVMGECLSSIKHVVGVRSVFLAEIARRIADKITPSCCLSEKWRIINLLDDIWMLLPEVESLGEDGGRPQCDKCGCGVRIAHNIVSRLWRQFQTTGTAIRGFSSGRPRGTTPADDRYIVLQARRNRRQTAGKIARHTTQATDERYRVLPWPEDCTVVVCLHDALYDESRFSLSSDSHRILIWRERGSRNHPSNIIERDRGAMGLQFLFMDDNAPCHRTVAAEQLLEIEDIERMNWPARSPDLNPIEHVWDFLGRRLAARTLPPVTIRELRLGLQDE